MVVFLLEQGLQVCRQGQRLKFILNRRVLEEIRLAEIDCIMAFGAIHFTTPVLHILMERGIEVFFFSSFGRYKGKLSPPASRNAEARIAQFEVWKDPSRRLETARAIVKGKVKNQLAVLKNRRVTAQNKRFHISLEKLRDIFWPCIKVA